MGYNITMYDHNSGHHLEHYFITYLLQTGMFIVLLLSLIF